MLTEGEFTKALEEEVSRYTSARHAIAVSSCTTGLEMALRVLNIGPGDEVIVPDYTYPATAMVVAITGAKCILADINPETLLIDYIKAEKLINRRTKAIIPVSIFGNPLDHTALKRIREKHNITIIEDAACALGSSFENTRTGNLAELSVFSFHSRKFVTTGEGGMITTSNDAFARWLRSYKKFGIEAQAEREGISFFMTGTNYKLSNILAAVGLEQMKMIGELITNRLEAVKRYDSFLRPGGPVSRPEITPGGVHSYQSYIVFTPYLKHILKEMREAGIEVQIGTYALHLQKAFRSNPSYGLLEDYLGSDKAFSRCMALPLFHDISEEQQKETIGLLYDLINKFNAHDRK
jgi:dTDP-4-amino-4,6-dideoxygalactose transaminase